MNKMKLYVLRSVLVVLIMLPALAWANEGMWLIGLLNRMQEAEMKRKGLNLTAQEIYDINNASLKDAIVRLNGGMCTGEMVSSQGLVFTNHHCAYDAIQSLATVENDILTNGFIAKSYGEELPVPGAAYSFLVRIDDVTTEVLEGITLGMSESERNQIVRSRIREITKRATEGNSYEAEVKSFFYGSEFYLMVYNTYRDIRLVCNPAESIGKFGGDTDNWMWPRHTGDFSVLRIYADKDNNPADYSESNVPYKPKHFLPINLEGVRKGDFAMILGYPGSTDRYLSSWGVKSALELTNPATIEIRDLKLKTMKKHMDADPAVRLKYASKYASTANYWKYFIGQNRGLKRLDVYGKKKSLEDEYRGWIKLGGALRAEKFGNALKQIEDYYEATNPTAVSKVYALEAGLIGAEIPLFAFRFGRVFSAAMLETDAAKRTEILQSYREDAEDFYKDFDLNLEKDVFVELMSLYRKNIPEDQRPSWMQEIDKKYKGNVKAYADKLYATTFFRNKTAFLAFLDKPSEKVYEKDMAVIVANSAIENYRSSFANPAQEKFDAGYRQFVAGLREMQHSRPFAPDANSTMRLTYGNVKGYDAADATTFDYYTTHEGILEKHDDNDPEFTVPARMVEMLRSKDFGRYANDQGKLPVCFIADLDITGGNSGSPVIDGDGNLIGIAFDGNWEAMSGDIAFEPELQRTIAVDVRYVLWVVDKLMGGKNIVDELSIAPKKPLERQVDALELQPSSPKEEQSRKPASNPVKK